MKILEFAFDSSEANDYLPYRLYKKLYRIYRGHMIMILVVGWFEYASEADRKLGSDYLDRD